MGFLPADYLLVEQYCPGYAEGLKQKEASKFSPACLSNAKSNR